MVGQRVSYQVLLHGGDSASGLADMLHQYLLQNCSEFPGKVRQARELTGDVLFRAAEDEAVCVRIAFRGESIGLEDVPHVPPGATVMTTDFLSVARLTRGEAGPVGLLARGKMRVRFSVSQLPFLVQVLRFMQLPEELREKRTISPWIWWAGGTLAAGGAGAGLYWYFQTFP
ncbi:MAG: hypothetical protein AB1405_12015 [Bdellovibrionota bacterium]